MPRGSPSAGRFEDYFPREIRGEACAGGSYSLELLGFRDSIPVLKTVDMSVDPSKRAADAQNLAAKADSVVVANAQMLKPVQFFKNVAANSANPKSDCSPLQGKKVIIKTNQMSGEKSLIFKQKTGQKVEIPAVLSTFLSNRRGSNAGVKAEAERCRPMILRRPIKAMKESTVTEAVKTEDIKVEASKSPPIGGDNIEITVPCDHDYINVPKKEEGEANNVSAKELQLVTFSSEPMGLVYKPVVTASNLKTVSYNHCVVPNEANLVMTSMSAKGAQKLTIESRKRFIPITRHLDVKRPTVKGNYEIVNGNQVKQLQSVERKGNTLLLMIPNNQILKAKTRDVKSFRTKVVPSNFRQKPRRTVSLQTYIQKETRDAETNTDECLLEPLVEKLQQERAVQNKASKCTMTETLEVPSQNCDFTSSLWEDIPMDILNDTPTFTGAYGFAVSPTVHLENFAVADLTNASYSTVPFGQNGVGAVQDLAGKVEGLNGQATLEPWKIKFFLDLKRCNQIDEFGNMPIHNAVIENNFTQVQKQCLALQMRRVDIDNINNNGLTPLQLAVYHNASEAIIKLLLQNGADPSVLDSEGNSLLHISVMHSSEAVMQLLLDQSNSGDLDATNYNGYTPLILCSMHKKYVKADYLLSAGADPNIGDRKSGRTPLFHAVEANDVEMVRLLLNNHAHTKVKNFFGTSPHDVIYELETIDTLIRNLILEKNDSNKPRADNIKVVRRKKKRDDEDEDDDELYSPTKRPGRS